MDRLILDRATRSPWDGAGRSASGLRGTGCGPGLSFSFRKAIFKRLFTLAHKLRSRAVNVVKPFAAYLD